jgi:hypothetical protein
MIKLRRMRWAGHIRGEAGKSLVCKEDNKLRDWKNVFTLDIPLELHTLMTVLTSLTHPRKILLVVLQTGK